MKGEAPQGLTAYDFHPQPYIDPRDVFPARGRNSPFAGKRSFGFNNTKSSQSSSRSSPFRNQCCAEDAQILEDDPNVFDCCEDQARQDCPSPIHHVERITSRSPADTSANCVSCEECIEDHEDCDEDEIHCVDECDECLDEHHKICGQNGQICTETCEDCDFSCFDCIDWNSFERDKTLGLSYTVPLIPEPDHEMFNNDSTYAISDPFARLAEPQINEISVAPLDLPVHHQCFQPAIPFWTALDQSQLCPSTEINFFSDFNQAIPQPNPLLQYGCHPAAIHEHIQMPIHSSEVKSEEIQHARFGSTLEQQLSLPPMISTITSNVSRCSNSSRICEWVMPCGTMCSASFASSTDLKKHMKAVHLVKGTCQCSWQGCDAKFASEAALTGHVSKKHTIASTDYDCPFKCTFPGCAKSFMYKQVRDEHVASHNGNKMYCHICDQFLNSEGSNFRRHMASHQPKHEHMLCKHHHLGCKRRFPRLDNLRRHEACCKFGKKAALHHHHHHRHVGH